MKRYWVLFFMAVGLCAGGCASHKDPSVPPAMGFPGPDAVEWEYKTVTLEGTTMGQINNQLQLQAQQGWQMVNERITVVRAGLGFRATVPLRRPK